MPFRLVQELEARFIAIDKWKESIRSAHELAQLTSSARARGVSPRTPENKVNELIKTTEDGYAKLAVGIHGLLHAPIIYAMGTRLADALIGPLRWPHTAAIVAMAVMSDLLRRKKPTNPKLIVAALSLMPRAISGSLTNLVGAAFCVYSLCPPFILYARNDISDRTEVRWIIIGLLVDGLYLCTAAFLGRIQFTSAWSVMLALLVSLSEFALLLVVMAAMFNSGPWDPYFKFKYVSDAGRVTQHPLSRIVEASIRFAVQLVVFLLNRMIRFLMFLVSHFESSTLEEISDGDRTYQYGRLPDGRSIRLLKILKGRPPQKVQCQFVVYKLGGSEQYEAISYVWGDNALDSEILLDGLPLKITRSAFDIIRKRRSMWEDKLIWIDQVSINQRDTDEKAAQVKMMSHIYKEAALVVACLGDSPSAYHIQILFATLHFLMHGLGVPLTVTRVLYGLTFRVWRSEAVGEFFGNDWFRRVWIIQEAALASRLHIIYGNICMDWEYLSRAMEALGNREMLDATAPSTHESLLAYTFGLRNVDPILELRGDLKGNRRLDLSHVLTLGNGFKSTEPKDKVYALLGMARDNSQRRIKPNYDEGYPVRDVYIDAMLFILAENDDPLRVLVTAGIGLNRSRGELPSWVPDWSFDAQLQIIDLYYSAAGTSKPVYRVISRSRGALSLDGVELDKVRYIGEPNGQLGEYRDRFQYLRWYFSAEQAAIQHMDDPHHDEWDRTESFIRTLLGNFGSYNETAQLSREQCHEYYRVARSYYETWEAQGGQGTPSPVLPMPGSLASFLRTMATMATLDKFLHFASLSTGTMSFCVTEQGRMAIVPPRSVRGDLICLIKGARRPYVMRTVNPLGQPLEYSLVGCCYVHGVMAGEKAGELEKSAPLVII